MKLVVVVEVRVGQRLIFMWLEQAVHTVRLRVWSCIAYTLPWNFSGGWRGFREPAQWDELRVWDPGDG